MKRKLTAVLLSIAMTLSLLAVPASAITPPGRVDGVDYGRIEENVSLRLPIDIQIGERVFRGSLENGATLSKEEVDAIIKQVMKEMGLNAGMLRFSEEIIQKAAKNLGFNPMVAFDLGEAFLLGATGLDNALSVYDVATGKAEAPGALANYAIGETLSSITGHAMGGVAGMIVSGLWNCTNVAAQEVARLITENEIAQQAIERTFLLQVFYNKCNEAIAKAEKDKGQNTWAIRCNQTVWCDKTLFGIKTLQYWRLSCDLQRDYIYGDEDDPTNYGGVFRGTMVIDIWHDLSNFDAQFMNLVLSQTSLPVSTHFSRKHDDHSASSLTKRLMRTNVEIHLDQNNMTSSGMTEFFSLKDFDDTSAFVVDHTVTVPHPHNWWDENGYLDMTVQTEIGPARIESNFWFKDVISGSLTYGNRYPELIYKNFSHFSDIKTSGAYSSYMGVSDYTQDYDFPIITDYQIFDDLRHNRGMVVVLGR